MKPRRGEIWWADLNPTRGSEQAGLRPVLVFQSNSINKFTRTVLAIPLTTNLRREELPSCVRISKGEGGLRSDSVAICHQLRVLDVSRLDRREGEVSDQVLKAVERCMLLTMGIDAQIEGSAQE